MAELDLEPRALLSQCSCGGHLPQGLSGSGAKNAPFVPAQSLMIRGPPCSESPDCHRERRAGLPTFPPPPLPAVEPFVFLDLSTTARLLIQKAQRDWARAACQRSSRWGLPQPELGGGLVRLAHAGGQKT